MRPRLGVGLALAASAGACTLSIGEVVDRAAVEAGAPADGTVEGSASEGAPPCPPDADTDSDPRNCGACGHDCLGGTCSGGLCQPLVLADGGAITVAVDDSYVYWSTTSGDIKVCPKANCAPGEFAPSKGAAYAIAVDDAGVYWTTSYAQSVVSCAKPNCTAGPTVLYQGATPTQTIAVDSLYVYWINQSGDGPDAAAGSVMRCGKWDCDGGPLVLATNQSSPSGLVVDDVTAYWLVDSPDAGALLGCAKEGCGGAPTVVAPRQSGGYVAVDDASLYWTQTYDTPDLSSCAKGGGTCFPSALVNVGSTYPFQVVLDDAQVYWLTVPPNGGGAVWSCAKPGCSGGPRKVASNQRAPGGIAVDDDAVYFTDFGAGTVLRIAKPLPL